jgi:RNA polymerase sigma factor (TIGR02999 family)
MADVSPSPLDDLFDALRNGDDRALEQLFAHVYDELRRLARVVRQGKAPATLNTTALVHEAYLHLRPSDALDVENKKHFFRLAARAMRQVVAYEVRRRSAQKRGGDALTVAFHDGALPSEAPNAHLSLDDLLTLEDALQALERMHDRQARVVECRFYAGLPVKDTADVLGVSTATVKRDWRAAKAWLASRLHSLPFASPFGSTA